jgi:hypothetical protein
MRYHVTCGVDSATYLDGEFEVEVGDLTYRFTPDERGRLVRMSITAPVEDVEKFRSEIIENPRPGVKADIIHKTDTDLFRRIISEFQRLESHIAFSFRLDAVKWQSPKTETICENDRERELAKIFALEVSRLLARTLSRSMRRRWPNSSSEAVSMTNSPSLCRSTVRA